MNDDMSLERASADVPLTTMDILGREGTPMVPLAVVSYEAIRIFQWINYSIGEVMNIFGTVTNIINIICFVKQGFKDSINVSLLGLAISDLGCLVTLLFTSLCFIPAFQEASLPFDSVQLQYLVTAWPHIIFTRVSSWITALITLERCLCITMPLKVKNIVTPKRATAILVCLFTVLICSASPIYYANRLAWKFSPQRNRSIIGLVFTEDREEVEQISFAVNNVFIPSAAFITIAICTVTLVVELRKKSEWRLKVTSPLNVDSVSERDQKVSKMVVMISTLFIVCFIPASFIFIAMLVEPSLSVGGRLESVLVIVYGLGTVLESTNSSLNIFIYYYMSSRYRTVFRQLFSLSQKS